MTPSSERLYASAEKAPIPKNPAAVEDASAGFVRLFLDRDGRLVIGLVRNPSAEYVDIEHPFFVIENSDTQGVLRLGLSPVLPLKHIKGIPSIKAGSRFTLVNTPPNDTLVTGYLKNVSSFGHTQLLNESK